MGLGFASRPSRSLAPVAAAILTIAAIVAASLSLTAGPALAKGSGNGGGGGGQPAPAPAPAASLCPEPEFANGGTYRADGSLLFANDFPVRCA
jgi:hypothetical protein